MARLPFVPCVEDEIDGVEPFLLEHPYENLRRGEINDAAVMIGANSLEGYFFAAMEDEMSLSEIDFEKSLPVDLEFPSQEERIAVGRNLSEFYSQDASGPASVLGKLSRLHGDPFFLFPVIWWRARRPA